MVPVDLGAREHKKESYLSLNSFGHVPALQDGGLKLFESRAISKYIASTYSDKGIELRSGKVLDVYEARLGRTQYLSGDSFGLADVHHQPVVHYLMNTPAKAVFEARPHVSKWAKVVEVQNK
ncbi:PREDICTED: glutathione S-transferase [Theobroma cacao]|uniref:glutathione transferase n=1 Tax=Theobroma cacao TaxID=3641 RepID=A0AB32VRM1_THECC|nr:PREDICTED: glutathione S-transferase [Theobroma cacao]